MRSIVIAFILIIAFGVAYFYIDSKKRAYVPDSDHVQDNEFVFIKDNQFISDGKPFFPKAINFIVSLRLNDTIMWPSVYISYVPQQDFHSTNMDSCIHELKATLQLIKDIGYNTVRLTTIGEPEIRDKYTGRINFKANYGTNYNYPLYLNSEEKYNKYFNAVELLLNAVEEAGLKAIFTTKLFHEAPETEEHFAKLTKHFSTNTTIMAYDFFNEPLYFDSLERKKEDVYYITKKWHAIQKTNAPNQMSTIGLACQRELFEWDPNIVNVDFISFHPYEYEPDQVRNELYWYYKFVNKPWIIGETGIPSNNDSIPYENQVAFAKKTLLQTFNCGGMGYSWWQYKDVEWGGYHQNYLGVVNNTGTTFNSKGQSVHGTPKPVNSAIKDFDPTQKKGPCECPPNYYNFSSNNQFRLSGKLLDEDGRPLEGGGILAWDEWWVNHYFSTTKADGSFELYSDYKFYHFMVSSNLYEMIRADIKPDTAQIVGGIPTINLGEFRLKKLKLKK
ncbi:MAG: cellulase family glycosylhydrolase [Bacteroidetes bacterium]|nr:cellulase family glycosylhydrolase [Bacteroidota bacterium]